MAGRVLFSLALATMLGSSTASAQGATLERAESVVLLQRSR